MIMALLIDLLLRGGKFFTLAARRTLWQMFENNECGPRILLDHENLLKLARATEAIKFGKDKDIQTNGEVISLKKDYVNYASVGDNRKVNPQAEDMQELKNLESQVDGALKDLEEAIPKKHSDASLDKLLDELERKVREVDTNEPVLLPVFMPQKIANKRDSFSSLQGCLSKFRLEEREVYEPILKSKPDSRSRYLNSSISDDLHIQFGKSRKYFKRITEHFSINTHNSLPDLTTPATLSFYSCRCMHTKSRNLATGTIWEKPRENYDDAAIREMLDKKLKLLAEKKDKRKKKNINRSEVKERERLLEINQKAFKKVEDDLKTVKIIEKHATNSNFVEVDELLSILDNTPKMNFLRNMKTHTDLPRYDTTTPTEFIVHMTPANENDNTIEIINKFQPKLNFFRLQEEIKANYKQNDSNLKSLQFMKYKYIPRICQYNGKMISDVISAELMGYVASKKRVTNALQINREWEKLNQLELHEEVTMRSSSLNKFTLPNSYENVRTMKTIDENIELEIAAMESKTGVLEMGRGVQEEVVKKLGENVTAEEIEKAGKVVMEQPKKVLKRKMKPKKNEEAKSKESVKMLVRPANVKKLARKGPKTKKPEEPVASNVKRVVQDNAKAEILEEKADSLKEYKVFNTKSLAVKEKLVDEHKAIEKISQQVEEIIVKVQQKAPTKDAKSNMQVEEYGEKNEQIVEQTENIHRVVFAHNAGLLEENSEMVTETQIQDQVQINARKSTEQIQRCEKDVESVVEKRMEVEERKAMQQSQNAPEKETLEKPSVSLAKSSEFKTDVEQEIASEEVHAEPTIASQKLEMVQQPTEDTSSAVDHKVIESTKERMPESDADKINLLPGSSMAKSRIPVRNKATGEATEAMETANKIIRKIASQYQVEKRETLIPKGCAPHRKRLRPLQKTGVRGLKSNKLPAKKEVEEDVDDAPVQLKEKRSIVKEVKDSASDVLKKLLNENSGEIKADGKIRTDLSIENEMPPDFDVLKEVDLVDIPVDDDEKLEVPAERKHTVVHSEKSLKDVKYCSDANKEKELLELLLDGQNLEKSIPQKNSKMNVSFKQHRGERKRPIQAIQEEIDESIDLKEGGLKTSGLMPHQNTHRQKIIHPVRMTHTESFDTTPKYTFWHRQPKTKENADTDKKEKEDQPPKTQPEGTTKPQKKYKMVTDEIEAIGGGKIKVTKLVEDV